MLYLWRDRTAGVPSLKEARVWSACGKPEQATNSSPFCICSWRGSLPLAKSEWILKVQRETLLALEMFRQRPYSNTARAPCSLISEFLFSTQSFSPVSRGDKVLGPGLGSKSSGNSPTFCFHHHFSFIVSSGTLLHGFSQGLHRPWDMFYSSLTTK